jgi:multidrug efflux pump subunit AcrA (membrane-fusion protein)
MDLVSHTRPYRCHCRQPYGGESESGHDHFESVAVKFRRAALRQLDAPEKLDEVVRLASAPAWLMGAALVVIVAVAAVWASVGTVASTVGAPGVLIHADGVSTLDATTTGQVVKWYVAPDGLATKGAPLYSVQGTDGRVRTVSAPWDAYVVSVVVTNGQYVQPGTPVATLEEVTGSSDPLEAVVFMPAAAAPTIPLGTGVTLSAPSAPASIFGTLSGTVASVGNFPETTDSLQAFLGQGVSTQSLLDSGSVVRVVIRLATVPGSATKLVWSKAAPGYTLDSESSVQASFVVSKQHPIDWLFG